MAISLPEGSFDALIFDCDGTLVDTAPAHLRALQEALEPLALTVTPGWYYPRVGLTPDALLDEYESQLAGPAPSPESVFARYNVAFQAGLHALKEVNVIADIVRRLHGRVPMAVASNGRRQNVEATLKAAKLLPLFDCIVAAEDVVHGKPQPDVFLEAARRMKVGQSDALSSRIRTKGWKRRTERGCGESTFERFTRRSGRCRFSGQGRFTTSKGSR